MIRIYLFLAMLLQAFCLEAQNVAYIKDLYRRYPTELSDFCPSCKIWINPFYESIADTQLHMPLVTHYIYTREHRLQQEALKLPRAGKFASWHAAYGQVNESGVYREANAEINMPDSPEEIAKGHCQAWILLAWDTAAAILSNTYTFNAAMEYQGQNTGTEEATENYCRKLTGWKSKQAVTDSIDIWCGTYGNKGSYTKGSVTVAIPEYYYKIMVYYDKTRNERVMLCYWMPNEPAEKKEYLDDRLISYAELKKMLGFDPTHVFQH